MTTITLPLPPDLVWGIAGVLAFALVCWGVYSALPRDDQSDAAAPRFVLGLQRKVGLQAMAPGVFFVLLLLWCVLFAVLFCGLNAVIMDLVMQVVRDKGLDEIRIGLLALAALTATTGAVVALPFTMIRIRLTHVQTETDKHALFNDKINAASADLHAMREITRNLGSAEDPNLQTLHEADVVRRCAAIDRLEGLVGERPEESTRVARLLSVYVRELSGEDGLRPAEPETDDPDELDVWIRSLRPVRSDMETAVQTIAKLAVTVGESFDGNWIDLRQSNLQAFDLRKADLSGARFDGAHLSGTILSDANLARTTFKDAHMPGADFRDADLHCAQLSRAHLQATCFVNAELNGASLAQAQLAHADGLGAHLVGAECFGIDLCGADFSWADLTESDLRHMTARNGTFEGTRFVRSRLTRAYFSSANLGSAVFRHADLSSADFSGAHMSEADLSCATLFDTYFNRADLQDSMFCGAYIERVDLGLARSLDDVTWTGAGLKHIDLRQMTPDDFDSACCFGDATVILPDDIPRPPHWPTDDLRPRAYRAAWRVWRRSIGFDPGDPSTWDAPRP
ncbi:MAG: pentapeptide repeat-containing protein [Marinibacterium sp.]|nr:pentapeptide repeat-containing protein [Marinibacterium sp.]